MITITQYAINTLTNQNLETSKKNIDSFRKNITRKLKKVGEWDNAQEKIIKGVKTKIFNENTLNNIDMRDYLIKLTSKKINIPLKIIKEKNSLTLRSYDENYEKGMQQAQWELENPEKAEKLRQEREYKESIEPKFNPNTPQMQQALHNLMLEALFNKFFKMTDEQKEKFLKDYHQIHNVDNSIILDSAIDNNDLGLTHLIASQERLEHPEKYYYNERE